MATTEPPDRLEGRISVHPRGFGFVAANGGDDDDDGVSAFIAPPDLNPFLAGDLVAFDLVPSGDGRFSAKKLALRERARSVLFGSFTLRRGRPHVAVDPEIGNTDWPLVGTKGAGLAPGDFLMARVDGDVARFERAVPPERVGVERVIARYQLRTGYPDDETVAAAVAVPVSKAGRRDLTAVPTVTIDASSTRDLDDALAVLPAGPDGALRLLVSIADVDHAVPAGSPLDEEARARGTSVYLAGQVLAMLPPAVSEGSLSLLPGEDRAALTAELRIDDEGEVTAIDLYETVIRSTARLSYAEVAAFLETNDPSGLPEAVRPTVAWLRTAAARLSAARRGRGGVDLLREEASITVDESDAPIELVAHESTPAHTLVERLMVAANEAVARWLVARGLPGLFRVHPEPEEDAVAGLAAAAGTFGLMAGLGAHLSPRGLQALEAQFAGTPLAPAMRTVLAKALGPARYTVHPGPHFGLAAPLYLHFTSPIRRYADLCVHRVVKGFLRGERGQVADDPRLEAIGVAVNELARNASRAERDRLRMLAARLFSARVGERFSGHVVAARPFGLIVHLSGVGVTGTLGVDALAGGPWQVDEHGQALVGRRGSWHLGQAVEVVVAGTDEDAGRIELTLA